MTKDKIERKYRSLFRVVAITAILTLLVAGIGAYLLGYLGPRHAQRISPETEKGGGQDRKIAYWRAPMNPTEIYDKPGKSAMGMDLVPVYEDELVGGVIISIDPVVQQNMGIRTAKVEKGPLVHTIRTYGHVTYDETRTAQVSPKFNGWIEDLYVDFTGKFVEKNEPLFTIYSPELFSAQEEYRIAYRSISRQAGSQSREMLASARRRLEYFDIPRSEIQAIEKTGEIKKNVMIRSPFSGVVINKNVVEGMNVKAGTMVYTIVDLSRVWVEAHIFEYELPWVKEGQEALMTLPYLPGKVFSGRVIYVFPYLQQKTRDVIIRLEFENQDLALKPDMYADVQIRSEQEDQGVLVPSEAIIRSGERNIVFLVRGKGQFTPREITPGLALENDNVQVLEGLAPGDIVVASGQFLLDSESKLKEAVQKMMERKPSKSGPIEIKKAPDKETADFFKELRQPNEDFFKELKGK
jgi:RND family efflux transporter MFP subunit